MGFLWDAKLFEYRGIPKYILGDLAGRKSQNVDGELKYC